LSKQSFLLACSPVIAIFVTAGTVSAITYRATPLQRYGDGSAAYGIYGGVAVGSNTQDLFGPSHAIQWSTSGGSVDLNPAGYYGSVAYNVSGTNQVGGAYVEQYSNAHATYWQGTAASAVDLNPAGFDYSNAYGVSDTQQVGFGFGASTNRATHALLWSGTAASAIDLNPGGSFESTAYGVADGHQVGYGGGDVTGNNPHALVWSGSAESYIDLNPTGFQASTAYGISGGNVGGWVSGATTGNNAHAALWHGSADSFDDLNPTGFVRSVIKSVAGNFQAGSGYTDRPDHSHALIWNGSADSVVDLHSAIQQLFPQAEYSEASAVDSAGNVVLTVGYFPAHAVLLRPVTDFNQNGTTDTADFVLWRKQLGTSYKPNDFNYWRAHFGETAFGGGLQARFGVPEPNASILFPVALAAFAMLNGRQHKSLTSR
jgi:hypothetical protein